MDLLAAAILLFLVMDPVGNVPIFITLLKDLPAARRRLVVIREMLIALLVLAIFWAVGPTVLEWLHLRQESVSIAGGIVLFLIGLRMIFPPADGIMGETPDGEPFIVPLAIPCVAGPSSMATLMLLGASHPDSQGVLLAALGLAWAGNLAVILGAVLLLRYLGKRLLIALERLMGMLLVTLSVQLFLDGVARYLGG
ncbi:MAG: YhgN family NAAT transporter [Xanthomonadales bacterium]|nr:YhgN family NAAT transporter [Xanthomonadales bacterium]MCB1627816.1 YhgN family NAAT transporter [Xanthomonadales bacterium]MCB1633342.1 YhgN family NAAT transporter [Xanthomonadales bacterium]MCB1640527.1 YhgN family NAAT transporter [Xanthomonadales bacterium]